MVSLTVSRTPLREVEQVLVAEGEPDVEKEERAARRKAGREEFVRDMAKGDTVTLPAETVGVRKKCRSLLSHNAGAGPYHVCPQ